MKQANLDVRQAIKDAGVRQWQVADALGIHEQNFSRMLRKELPWQTKTRIFHIVEKMKAEFVADLTAAQ